MIFTFTPRTVSVLKGVEALLAEETVDEEMAQFRLLPGEGRPALLAAAVIAGTRG